MSTYSFKVESGIQLLSRLCKKTELELFYPVLFSETPKYGELIELITDDGQTFLLNDILSEVLLPTRFGGSDCGVLFVNTDGNFCCDNLVKLVTNKITLRQPLNEEIDIQPLLQESLSKLHLIEVYDSTQMYTTIYNLETILHDDSYKSLIIFNSLTAFYWSEQGHKIMKMDLFLKKLLNIILNVTKDYKVIILYTKPEYFNSPKDIHDGLPNIHHQIQTQSCDNETMYNVIARTHNKQFLRKLTVKYNHIVWL